MPIRILDGEWSRIVEVLDAATDATLDDLLQAVGCPTPSGPDAAPIRVDGVGYARCTSLREVPLPAGATIVVGDTCSSPPTEPPATTWSEHPTGGLHVRVVGGLHAGASIPLGRGIVVGRRDLRSPDHTPPSPTEGRLELDDRTVSVRHLHLEPTGSAVGATPGPTRVVVRDLMSKNGTWLGAQPLTTATPLVVGAVVRCGASQLALADSSAPPVPVPPTPSGLPGRATGAFERPPRRVVRDVPVIVAPPEVPLPRTTATSVGIATLLVPVLVAGVAVAVTGSWWWGAFAVLGPLSLLGGVVDQKRERRRHATRSARAFSAELARFVEDLSAVADKERLQRHHALPDPAEVTQRAVMPTTTLWERRPTHDDAFVVRLGTGTIQRPPPVPTDVAASLTTSVLDRSRSESVTALHAALADASALSDTAIPLALGHADTVGIAGPRTAVLALARSLLLQVSVLHGPADVQLSIATQHATEHDWTWAAWLPHLQLAPGHLRMAAGPAAIDLLETCLADAKSEANAPGGRERRRIIVVDDPSLVRGHRAPARRLLREPPAHTTFLVLTPHADELPGNCAVLVAVDQFGSGTVVVQPPHVAAPDLLACGVSEATAAEAARSLARLSDPEADRLCSRVPARIRLLDVLDDSSFRDEYLDAALQRTWGGGTHHAHVRVPIGIGADGPVDVDLISDGPHALVAGTTGAGKSELLRSLVAALAAHHPPEAVQFVLVDFKGGSAFDRLAALPHTAGVVTDLDAPTAARAIRGLERELTRREELLRRAGAVDMEDLARRAGSGDPLVPARLVVVVDEFATLAAALPDVLDALIAVAQRGRSLGLHLVLATQRPAGVVNDKIRANTALRIALRLPDARDSVDVIDVPDASALPRARPGRALLRFGHDELVQCQVAQVQVTTPDRTRAPVRVAHLWPRSDHAQDTDAATAGQPNGASAPAATQPVEAASAQPDGEPTDLDRLVAAARRVHVQRGGQVTAALWSPPLPARVSPEMLVPTGSTTPVGRTPAGVRARAHTLVVALADRHDEQGHDPAGWDPTSGALVLEGPRGSGTTTALRALARAALLAGPHAWHVHIIDGSDCGLASVADLPGAGTVATCEDNERQARLIGRLHDELRARRTLPNLRAASAWDGRSSTHAGPHGGTPPRQLLLIDDAGTRLRAWDDPLDRLLDRLRSLVSEGGPLGVHVALATHDRGALPSTWRGLVPHRWLFGADAVQAAGPGHGIGPIDCASPPGRAWLHPEGRWAQLADVADAADHLTAADAPSSTPRAGRKRSGQPDAPQPFRVGLLPRHVALEDLAAHTPSGRTAASDESEAHLWHDGQQIHAPETQASGGTALLVGISDRTLAPVALRLPPAGHALVLGPPRSGRTNALVVLAHAARDGGRGRAHGLTVLCVACRRAAAGRPPVAGGWLDPSAGIARLARAVEAGQPTLALLDDLDALDDPHSQVLTSLVRARPPGLQVVAAATPAAVRSAYGHVVRDLRADRTGLLLAADPDLDGELLGTQLPRRHATPTAPGRGWLVHDSQAEFMQLARASPLSTDTEG